MGGLFQEVQEVYLDEREEREERERAQEREGLVVYAHVAVVVLDHLAVDLWVQFSIKRLCHWRCLDYNKHIDGVEPEPDTKEKHMAESLVVEGEEDRTFYDYEYFSKNII
jgi:hypothetical protein